MSRHRATETWQQRADRCIRELNGPDAYYGRHRAGTWVLANITYRAWRP